MKFSWCARLRMPGSLLPVPLQAAIKRLCGPRIAGQQGCSRVWKEESGGAIL